jgi:hypothetical protein
LPDGTIVENVRDRSVPDSEIEGDPEGKDGEPWGPWEDVPPPDDLNWDAEFTEMELAEQEAKLTALAKKWERREEEEEYWDSIRSGFGPGPERINGRFAMFFLITGLATEYYTGQSIPQQVETLLQTFGLAD